MCRLTDEEFATLKKEQAARRAPFMDEAKELLMKHVADANHIEDIADTLAGIAEDIAGGHGESAREIRDELDNALLNFFQNNPDGTSFDITSLIEGSPKLWAKTLEADAPALAEANAKLQQDRAEGKSSI